MPLNQPLKLLKSSALFALALSCSGCFWVPAETGVRMQSDIRGLQDNMRAANKHLEQQAAHLEEQSAQLATQMKEAADKVAEVAEALQSLNRAARMTDADLGVQIERLIKEVQELRGSVELSDYRLGKMEGQLEGDQSLVARIESLEKEQNALPIATKTSSKSRSTKKVSSKKAAPAKTKTKTKTTTVTKATSPKPKAKKPPQGKKELLAYGEALVKDGKIQDARGVFRDLVRRYPKSKGITDKAFFTLGETYFQNKKYRNALQEYIKVVDRFPKGAMADDAYYRIGSCSMEIGNLEDANIFFNEIVSNHKKSPLLKAARGKLKEVQKRLSKEKNKKKTLGKKG
ncbi:MAG: tetratricopeptide repeat protein [Deltaproteobacteria bacterium]|nr:tetratricopeptide repeat protein [Deltaproteobacteria bacterium]MBT6492663.1 tetratricopeptide repeat protein [Deltaproteobacteria bacterium]